MVRSTIRPMWFWIRDLKGTNAKIRVRWALKELQIEDELQTGKQPVSHVEYEYEEREIDMVIPKPSLNETTISYKVKTERYAYPDAVVELTRLDNSIKLALDKKKATIIAALGVAAEDVI